MNEPTTGQKLWATVQPWLIPVPIAVLAALGNPQLIGLWLLLVLARYWWVTRQSRHAEIDKASGRMATAEKRLRQLRTFARFSLHPAMFRNASMRLGELQRRGERLEEAAATIEQALPRQPLGKRSARVQAILHNNLGVIRKSQGLLEDAEREYKAAIEVWKHSGQPDPSYAGTWENLAELYASSGRQPEAIEALGEAVKVREGVPQRDEAAAIATLRLWARQLPEDRDGPEKENAWRRILDFYTRSRGTTSEFRLEPLNALMGLYDRQHREKEYREAFQQWLACETARPGREPLPLARARLNYCMRLLTSNDGPEAEAIARKLLAELPAEAAPERAWAWHVVAQSRQAAEDWMGAETACGEALAVQRGAKSFNGTRHVELLILLGEARAKQRQLLTAQESFEQALSFLKENVKPDHPWIKWTQTRLSQLWTGSDSPRVN